MQRRRSIRSDTRQLILHEAAFKCANPVCRHPLTLDIHHLTKVAENGANTPDNLLALCPNCHALHHAGHIPEASLRTWKMVLLALNEAFDRTSVDLLLAIDKVKPFVVSDGIIHCAALIASQLVDCGVTGPSSSDGCCYYRLVLTEKGRSFVEAWKRGDQKSAVAGIR